MSDASQTTSDSPTADLQLDWRPALERPELLATSVLTALIAMRDAGVDVATIEATPLDPAYADTQVLVDHSDIELEDCANCIVVSGQRAGDERVAACLVLGTTRADVNKTVRKHLDVRKISFMSMDDAVARTSMEYGGITPIGLPEGWPVLVDAAVLERDVIVIGAGVRAAKIRLPGRLAAQLVGAEVIDGMAS